MRIKDPGLIEKMIKALTEPGVRKVLCSTVVTSKSATQLSEELNIPIRSVYRHITDLCDIGLLTSERAMLIDSGGKFVMYRSMVKSVSILYNSERDSFEVDIIPNENILGKFMRFWSYMGG